jgi:hypothetical protein
LLRLHKDHRHQKPKSYYPNVHRREGCMRAGKTQAAPTVTGKGQSDSKSAAFLMGHGRKVARGGRGSLNAKMGRNNYKLVRSPASVGFTGFFFFGTRTESAVASLGWLLLLRALSTPFSEGGTCGWPCKSRYVPKGLVREKKKRGATGLVSPGVASCGWGCGRQMQKRC